MATPPGLAIAAGHSDSLRVTAGWAGRNVAVVVGDLTWVRASYPSPRGPIVSHWQRDGRAFHWQVDIPPNATATVFVPAEDAAGVTDGERPAAQAEGFKFLRMQDRAGVFAIGSGQYQIRSTVDSCVAK